MRAVIAADDGGSDRSAVRTRCRALGEALQALGADVQRAGSDSGPGDMHAKEWCPERSRHDVPDLFIVDRRACGAERDRAIARHARCLVAIDPPPDGRDAADVVLCQSFSARHPRVDHLHESGYRLHLTGSAYRLFSSEVEAHAQQAVARDGPVSRVLIDCAEEGCEPSAALHLTREALHAVSDNEFAHLHVHVVVHPEFADDAGIRALLDGIPDAAMHVSKECPAALMAGADVAIGCAGHEMYERCAVGLPSLVLAMQADTSARARALHDEGVISFPEDQMLSADIIRTAFRSALRAPRLLRHQSMRGIALFPCGGAARVADLLVNGISADEWRLRDPAHGDLPRMRDLVRRVDHRFAEEGSVTAPDAGDWCAESVRTGDPAAALIESDAGMVGVTRLDRSGRHARGKVWRVPAMAGVSPRSLLAPAILRAHAQGWFRPTTDDVTEGGAAAGCDETAPRRITILSARETWLRPTIGELLAGWADEGHAICWVNVPDDIPAGDICFMIGAASIVPPEILARHHHNLVVHESALPEDRGWSPLSWQILDDRREIVASLIEAAPEVDSGDIVLQETMRFGGHELVDELRRAQAHATLHLCRQYVAEYPGVHAQARPQQGTPSFRPGRTPDDSRIDPAASLEAQFDLLRICDPHRYPAFFDLRGHRYRLHVERDRS